MNHEPLNAGRSYRELVGEFTGKDIKRFFAKCEPVGECWEWRGYKDSKGYGQFWYKTMMWWAHRWAYAIFVGNIPDGETVNHVCRNPSCVRPAHLEVMSRVKNTALGNHHRRVDAGLESEPCP